MSTIDLGTVNTMATQTVKKIKNVSQLDSFYLNPFNPRNLEDQQIDLVETDEGFKFVLSDKVSVSTEYRTQFQNLLDSLITVDSEVQEVEIEGKTHKVYNHFAHINVKQPGIVTPVKNGTAQEGHIWLSGNSRFNIIRQVVEKLGKDNVVINFPYIIAEDYDPNNYLQTLLTVALVDNSGVTILNDSESMKKMLDRAYNSLEFEHNERLTWISDNLIYSRPKYKTGSKIVPASFLTKWKGTKENPDIVSAIESYVGFQFIYRVVKVFIENLHHYESREMGIQALTQLLIDFVVDNKVSGINTEKYYTAFVNFISDYFKPTPELPTENGEAVESDDSTLTEIDSNSVLIGEKLTEKIKSVQDLSYVVLEYDFQLLDQKEQEKASLLIQRVEKILNQLNKLTMPTSSDKEEKTDDVESNDVEDDEMEDEDEMEEDDTESDDGMEDTEGLEALAQ